jgi:hypothetical protein
MMRDVCGIWHITSVGGTPVLAATGPRGIVTLFDDASSEYLQVATPISTGNPFSVSSWFNIDDDTATSTMVGIGVVGANSYYRLFLDGAVANDPVYFGFRTSAPDPVSESYASVASVVSANKWHHSVGIRYAANSHAVIVDGVFKDTTATAAAAFSPDVLRIGAIPRTGPKYYLSGMAADVRVYDRALSDAESWAMYDPATRWELYKPITRYWAGSYIEDGRIIFDYSGIFRGIRRGVGRGI